MEIIRKKYVNLHVGAIPVLWCDNQIQTRIKGPFLQVEMGSSGEIGETEKGFPRYV